MAVPVCQLHVLLAGVEPAVWRRMLVSGDTSLAGLHGIVQAAFGWSDARGHYFVIRGKQYGGAQSPVLSESATLATFRFRMKERFLYHYGLSDGWQHQVRFEGTPVLSESLASSGLRRRRSRWTVRRVCRTSRLCRSALFSTR